MKFNDLTNQEFERLTAKRYLGGSRWECLCKCGKVHVADAYHLRSGMILSCGCLGIERRAAALRALIIPIAERFWVKVQKIDDADSCWEWTAKKVKDGYGQIREAGKDSRYLLAHRVSYELNVGPIPEGLKVLHRCDNPPCVRPSHLFVGTSRDNAQDAVSKGRMSVGEINPRAILTEAKVKLIRQKYADAPLSRDGKRKRNGAKKLIAAETGASMSQLNSVVYGQCWNHLTAELFEPEGEPAAV